MDGERVGERETRQGGGLEVTESFGGTQGLFKDERGVHSIVQFLPTRKTFAFSHSINPCY